MDSVVIGADPHKHSVTIEIVDQRERVLHKGRYGTDADGYQRTLVAAGRFPQRRWAVEGCNGIGKHVAQRLVADGETVVDVPAKLAARARVFDTGNGRKTDPADAHSVAVVALRTPRLTQVRPDGELVLAEATTRDGVAPVRQVAYVVRRTDKLAALCRILDVEDPTSALVFGRTRGEVDDLAEALRARGHDGGALHGGLTQEGRDRMMGRFRDGSLE